MIKNIKIHWMLERAFWSVFSLSFLFLFSSCSASAQEFKATTTLRVNNVSLYVAVAEDNFSRARGLMRVEQLGQEEGMLFVFEKPQRLSFWMKNTPLPLSIAYINKEGIIKEIYDMQPFSEKSVPSQYSVLYALELNKGAFKALGIKVGDKIEGLPSLE